MKDKTLPEWAQDAIEMMLQEIEYETGSLDDVYGDDVVDFVCSVMPRTMTHEQFERDVKPLAKAEVRRYGVRK